MTNVIQFPVTFRVHVTFDKESRMFTAVCDDLCIVTEDVSLDAVRSRVWEIAPEMAHENGHDIPVKQLRLHFDFDESYDEHLIAM